MNLGNTGRPGAGFGFVTFAKEEAAREALQNKDNIFFNKLQLNIEEKKTRVSFRQFRPGQPDTDMSSCPKQTRTRIIRRTLTGTRDSLG